MIIPSYGVPAWMISFLDKSNAMYSGLETSTCTLCIAISALNESLNACNACFEAANDERKGIGTFPATLLTITTLPDFR